MGTGFWRPWLRWWGSLSPVRQDRFAALAPVAAVLLFLAAILSAFAYLRMEELDRAQEALKRETLKTQSPTKRGRQMTGIEIEPDSFHGNGLAPSGVVR